MRRRAAGRWQDPPRRSWRPSDRVTPFCNNQSVDIRPRIRRSGWEIRSWLRRSCCSSVNCTRRQPMRDILASRLDLDRHPSRRLTRSRKSAEHHKCLSHGRGGSNRVWSRSWKARRRLAVELVASARKASSARSRCRSIVSMSAGTSP
jgi:hypothetical protein